MDMQWGMVSGSPLPGRKLFEGAGLNTTGTGKGKVTWRLRDKLIGITLQLRRNIIVKENLMTREKFEVIKITLGALMHEFEDVPEDEQVRLTGLRAKTVIEQLSDLSQALNRLQRENDNTPNKD